MTDEELKKLAEIIKEVTREITQAIRMKPLPPAPTMTPTCPTCHRPYHGIFWANPPMGIGGGGYTSTSMIPANLPKQTITEGVFDG